MSLTACRECEQQVSDEAAACPHCGADRPTAVAVDRHDRRIFNAAVALVLAAGVAVAGYEAWHRNQQDSQIERCVHSIEAGGPADAGDCR